MGNIWEVAKQMELEGIEYYTNLANEAELDELKGVFLFLADQEEDHFKLFDFLQEGEIPTIKQIEDAYSVAKKAFKQLAPDFREIKSLARASTAYKKAVSLEQNAIDYYSKVCADLNDDTQKEVVQTIIREEVKHRVLMEAICDFVDKPNEWIENKEFNRLEDFE